MPRKKSDAVIDQTQPDDEPIGIVISRGSRSVATPRFSAYIWGEEPGEETVLTSAER